MKKSGYFLRIALCLTMLFGLAAFATAQETTGSISGTITDSSAAAIKGASVILTNTDRGQDVRVLT
ncbi:MAG TPA: carboxypeptidase-like regulatory domain-containing protein, partial [Acidobacteriaceae bacterium]